jgi:hypothetical protein
MSPKTTWLAGAAPEAIGLPPLIDFHAHPRESPSLTPELRLSCQQVNRKVDTGT